MLQSLRAELTKHVRTNSQQPIHLIVTAHGSEDGYIFLGKHLRLSNLISDIMGNENDPEYDLLRKTNFIIDASACHVGLGIAKKSSAQLS